MTYQDRQLLGLNVLRDYGISNEVLLYEGLQVQTLEDASPSTTQLNSLGWYWNPMIKSWCYTFLPPSVQHLALGWNSGGPTSG